MFRNPYTWPAYSTGTPMFAVMSVRLGSTPGAQRSPRKYPRPCSVTTPSRTTRGRPAFQAAAPSPYHSSRTDATSNRLSRMTLVQN